MKSFRIIGTFLIAGVSAIAVGCGSDNPADSASPREPKVHAAARPAIKPDPLSVLDLPVADDPSPEDQPLAAMRYQRRK